MKRIWLEKDGTLQVLTDENLDDVKRVLVTRKGSLYGCLFYPDSEKRPNGKWTLNADHSATCSVCGHTQLNAWDVDNSDNFCHFCGADMREVEHETD